MRGKVLTICIILSLIAFGWGMWGFATNKRGLFLERAKPIQTADELHAGELAEKRLSDTLLLSKIVMIAGLAGIFASIYYLNKPVQDTKYKRQETRVRR